MGTSPSQASQTDQASQASQTEGRPRRGGRRWRTRPEPGQAYNVEVTLTTEQIMALRLLSRVDERTETWIIARALADHVADPLATERYLARLPQKRRLMDRGSRTLRGVGPGSIVHRRMIPIESTVMDLVRAQADLRGCSQTIEMAEAVEAYVVRRLRQLRVEVPLSEQNQEPAQQMQEMRVPRPSARSLA